MPFDILLFNGGMRNAGIPSVKRSGIQHYKLNNYADLNYLLGNNWHYWGLNGNGDYGFVVLETVDFYMHKARSLVEFKPLKLDDDTFASSKVDTGHSHVFCFVCNYSTCNTFGKDKGFFNLLV